MRHTDNQTVTFSASPAGVHQSLVDSVWLANDSSRAHQKFLGRSYGSILGTAGSIRELHGRMVTERVEHPFFALLPTVGIG